MKLLDKEHYEIIAAFEKAFPHEGRKDKEDIAFWKKGRIYQNGEVNKLFLAFRYGVAYGAAVEHDKNL